MQAAREGLDPSLKGIPSFHQSQRQHPPNQNRRVPSTDKVKLRVLASRQKADPQEIML